MRGDRLARAIASLHGAVLPTSGKYTFTHRPPGRSHIRLSILSSLRLRALQPTDNFLFRIELFPPPKAEAVAFLDGVGPKPERFARAIVYRGADSPRHIMEYKVNPGMLNLWPLTGIALAALQW